METEEFLVFGTSANTIVSSLVFAGITFLVAKIYLVLILQPSRIRSKLKKQGIHGPSPVFLYGNIPQIKQIQLDRHSNTANRSFLEGGGIISHDWPAAVFPHIERWRNEYGPVLVYTMGNIETMAVVDPEMVKEIGLCNSLNLGKPCYLSRDRGPLLGDGILTSNGPFWAHQKKIIAPEFYLDKVKGMVSIIVDSTIKILESWDHETNKKGNEGVADMRVDEYMRSLSADIISRACFGSSYTQGQQIFTKLHTLLNVMSKVHLGVPGLRHIPIKHNRDIWRLSKEIDTAILDMVNVRREASHEKDLLQLILDAAKDEGDKGGLPNHVTPNKFIIDNCKNIYLAGHETTATSASWCLMLLAAHPNWQERIRNEVLQVCGVDPPDAEKLRHLKMLTMFIQEALRLYPPVAFVIKEALQDIEIKGILIPKGVNIQINISFLHQNQQLWGPDAHMFNPERFNNGVANACKIPQAYIPFGLGTRTCLGQHFAMAELKVILSLILARFGLTLSSNYVHSPVFRMVIQPGHGVKLCLRRL